MTRPESVDALRAELQHQTIDALNAAMKRLSLALRERGIGVLLLHPGWVKIRTGAWDAPLTAAESVAGMRTLADAFSLDQSGRFLRYNGTEIPW